MCGSWVYIRASVINSATCAHRCPPVAAMSMALWLMGATSTARNDRQASTAPQYSSPTVCCAKSSANRSRWVRLMIVNIQREKGRSSSTPSSFSTLRIVTWKVLEKLGTSKRPKLHYAILRSSLKKMKCCVQFPPVAVAFFKS